MTDMKPVIVGPPGYGSPDPETNKGRLVPLEQHPLKDSIDPEYGNQELSGKAAPLVPGAATSGQPSVSNEDANATAGAIELADLEGVDLSEVEGTGEDGRVTKADVQAHLDGRDDA